jgi:hypothetical protein
VDTLIHGIFRVTKNTRGYCSKDSCTKGRISHSGNNDRPPEDIANNLLPQQAF